MRPPVGALCAAAALLALLLAPATATGAAVALQADAQHSGNAGGGGPALPLRRAWTAKLDYRVGYPVVAEGKAFVVTAPRVRQAPRVVALDLRTGRRVWQRDLSGETLPRSAALAYDAGRLFVTRNISSEPRESAMFALSPADGRTLWETGRNLTLFNPVPPVAADGVVYLGEIGDGDGGISAWRQEDGAPLWRVGTELGGGDSVAVAGDLVVTGVGCEPYLFRVRRDGTALSPRSSRCSSGGGETAVLAGGRALLRGYTDSAGVFDVASGARVSALHSDYLPAVADGVALLTEAHIPGETAYRGHTLIAREVGGRVLWRFRGDGYLDSAPLVARGSVFVGSGTGTVYALDLRTGRVRSRADAGASVLPYDADGLSAALAADSGVLLVPARGRLVAFV